MPTRDPSVRLTRLCDGCGAIDDHPHHVIHNLTAEGDRSTSMHHDCCAERGCETCAAVLATVGDARGHDLLAAISDGAVDHLTTGAAK